MVDATKYHWVYRADVIYPVQPYGIYKLLLSNYWIANDQGNLLFWDGSPQCNSSKMLAESLLKGTQKHLDEPARVVYIERAWVPLDPKDWT